MLVFTTLFIAALVIVILWFVALRHIRHAWLGYAIVLAVGVACFFLGSVHFVYIGIEIIFFGCLLVWLHARKRARRVRIQFPKV